MGRSLNKTEIVGLAFLALLVVGITASAVLLKNCRGASEGLPEDVRIEVVDTIGKKAPAKEEKSTGGRKKQARKEKEGKSKSRRKKSAAESVKGKAAPAERKDPFADTVPVISNY